jgi:hypothetical protein
LGKRAVKAYENENKFAARMYLGGAKQFEKVAKRDFNLMRGQLGKEFQSATGIKKLDAIAGKNLDGFKGVQEKFVKGIAEEGKKLARTPEEQNKLRQQAIDEHLNENAGSDLANRHTDASQSHEEYKAIRDNVRKESAQAMERFQNEMRGLERELKNARATAGENSDATRDVQRRIIDAKNREKNMLNEQNVRIRDAQRAVTRSAEVLKNVENDVAAAAVESGRLPAAFKSASDISKDLTKASYTAILRATIPTAAGIEALASKTGKEADKQVKKEKRKETFDIIKEIQKEEGGGHAPAAPEGGGTAPAGGAHH